MRLLLLVVIPEKKKHIHDEQTSRETTSKSVIILRPRRTFFNKFFQRVACRCCFASARVKYENCLHVCSQQRASSASLLRLALSSHDSRYRFQRTTREFFSFAFRVEGMADNVKG